MKRHGLKCWIARLIYYSVVVLFWAITAAVLLVALPMMVWEGLDLSLAGLVRFGLYAGFFGLLGGVVVVVMWAKETVDRC